MCEGNCTQITVHPANMTQISASDRSAEDPASVSAVSLCPPALKLHLLTFFIPLQPCSNWPTPTQTVCFRWRATGNLRHVLSVKVQACAPPRLHLCLPRLPLHSILPPGRLSSSRDIKRTGVVWRWKLCLPGRLFTCRQSAESGPGGRASGGSGGKGRRVARRHQTAVVVEEEEEEDTPVGLRAGSDLLVCFSCAENKLSAFHSELMKMFVSPQQLSTRLRPHAHEHCCTISAKIIISHDSRTIAHSLSTDKQQSSEATEPPLTIKKK